MLVLINYISTHSIKHGQLTPDSENKEHIVPTIQTAYTISLCSNSNCCSKLNILAITLSQYSYQYLSRIHNRSLSVKYHVHIIWLQIFFPEEPTSSPWGFVSNFEYYRRLNANSQVSEISTCAEVNLTTD